MKSSLLPDLLLRRGFAPGMVVALALLSGCNHNKQPQPVMVSSAFADGYAIEYPQRLSAETDNLVADKQKANELVQKFPSRAIDLKLNVDPALLLLIVQQADEAGRGEAYATAYDEERGVRSFWDEERGHINGRVNAAAQKQITDAKCEVDVGGAIGYALKDGVDKQLEKRLRAQNEAQRTVDRNKVALGGNFTAVQKLADDIAFTSYLVNIALVLDRNRIDRLLAERSDVDSTLVDALEREREYQAGSRTAAEKKLSQERTTELDKSRAMLAPAANNAENARNELDPLIENLRKEYANRLEALEDDLKQQAAQAKR